MGLFDWLLPDKCTPWKINPLTAPTYWEVVAALKLTNGKFGITNRSTCEQFGHKVAENMNVGGLLTDTYIKCACKNAYGEDEPAVPVWHNWENIGGNIRGRPGVVAIPTANIVDLYVRWADDTLYQKSYNNGTWIDWHLLDNSLQLDSSPVVISHNEKHRDVYVKAKDGKFYHKYWDGNQWSVWEAIGGNLKGIGAVAIPSAGITDLYGIAGDGSLWQKSYTQGHWIDWHLLDKSLALVGEAVTVVSHHEQHRDIYARAASGVYHKFWTGDQWSNWELIGNADLIDNVGVVAIPSEGITDIYATAMRGIILQKSYNKGQWYDWHELVSSTDKEFRPSSGPVVISLNPLHRDIYVRKGSNVYHKFWS